MSAARMQRPAGPPDTTPAVIFGALALAVVLVGGTWLAAHLGLALGDDPVHIDPNPLAYLLQLVIGKAAWPGLAATICAITLAAIATGLGALAAAAAQRWRDRDRRGSIDARARHLATRADVRDLGPKAAADKAVRLRPAGVGAAPGEHGIALGTIVGIGQPALASFEDTLVVIAGPRVGKTVSYVVPTIVDSPGPVVATSNKRDVHDLTRDVRAARGQVWLFDPNDKVGAEPEFWFDPLGEITSIDDARELASHFAMGSRAAGARTDAYFDGEGESLLARTFLAAARGRRTLTDAYTWLQNPYDSTPVALLRHAGDLTTAAALEATAHLADKQRDGIYGTARSFVRCLENPAITRWVTPPAKPLPKLEPAAIAASADTVYCLSEEGEGSAGPLVAALTQAIFTAGRRRATHSPGGRLDPPLVTVLDEAANVVRLRRLPSLYSHLGSQGLPVMTVLQSWAQGTDVWGEGGMKTLWDASTVRLYLGGAADSAWLERLSQNIGPYDRDTVSTSYDGRGGRSRSLSTRTESIYTAADLGALPKGRALALIAGHRPLLLHTQPWMQGPHAEAIRASFHRWDPGTRTGVTP
ncbi:conjugal transfer protein [Prauserella sp. PE36]|uniref:type IV secretory system conjugative DNA transfer family protein n=1 Tax=Prauserella sp. PE36 TaxID=1504709 RepID=UPI000DE2F12D|nr:type IV secretory system conjugative DNA transfer family protein [Prauserella sp. PE36]RBM18112.1 conjugal transfer protein [Prauserella sp. PE36]